MAITVPLPLASFWNELAIEEMTFGLNRYEANGGRSNGDILTTVKGDPRWGGRVTLGTRERDDAARIDALLNMLRGSVNAFQAYDILRQYPASDPTGSSLGSAPVTVYSVPSLDALQVQGLPAAYALTVGDMIAIPSRLYLGQIQESRTASAGGITTTAFAVEPYLPATVVAGDAVVLKRPYGFFKADAASLTPRARAHARLAGSLSFDFIQVLE